MEELEEPLIALGLVASREEVEALMKTVDDDGEIVFEEFLDLVSGATNAGQGGQSNLIQNFFKKMMDGKFPAFTNQKLAFSLNVSQYRRQRILDSIMGETVPKRKLGKKIREGFEGWLEMDKAEKMLEGGDPEDVSFDDIAGADDGANTRTGFPKHKNIIKTDASLLIKPRTVNIQGLHKRWTCIMQAEKEIKQKQKKRNTQQVNKSRWK